MIVQTIFSALKIAARLFLRRIEEFENWKWGKLQ
jgi:hypothetical protein